MDRLRQKNSPSSERFLGSFTPSPPDSSGSAGFELHEDELFSTGVVSPEPAPSPRVILSSSLHRPNQNPNPNPNPTFLSRFRRPPEGILDALPDDAVHRRRSPVSTSSSSNTSPASSSSRMIPAIPKPKPEYGRIQPQSAPVNVPVPAARSRERLSGEVEEVDGGEDEEEEEEMLPPHEMVARARARESPMTTFSVLEGAGRTLKGRDLRQVRNAVLRRTGFLD